MPTRKVHIELDANSLEGHMSWSTCREKLVLEEYTVGDYERRPKTSSKYGSEIRDKSWDTGQRRKTSPMIQVESRGQAQEYRSKIENPEQVKDIG